MLRHFKHRKGLFGLDCELCLHKVLKDRGRWTRKVARNFERGYYASGGALQKTQQSALPLTEKEIAYGQELAERLGYAETKTTP